MSAGRSAAPGLLTSFQSPADNPILPCICRGEASQACRQQTVRAGTTLEPLPLAVLDILTVWGTIPWMVIAVWKHRRWVAVAQVPYLIWVSIATVLQLSITWMNWRLPFV